MAVMDHQVKVEEIELLLKVINIMLDWSGVSDDTPDDYEVMSDPPGLSSVTLGDLRDASLMLNNLWNAAKVGKNKVAIG